MTTDIPNRRPGVLYADRAAVVPGLLSSRPGHASMRVPTSEDDAFRWYNDTLAGLTPPIHDGWPECGWFKTKLVRGGPWSPARIWLESEVDDETGELACDEVVMAEVDGMPMRPASIWLRLTPITQQEHASLTTRRDIIPAMEATKAVIDLTQEPILP